ncbi:MAG: T9SS type A sorting domain-containing protein [Ignavibacteria bacterium]|nr:T9SS type A sorting domain-containing protein [Ignavibacteria bacterium]MBT8392302.1 T9SS type A sorting domain-containing protein [Ignavibacteria bacterium]NNJ52464.1 T9SS type A sorting domain-containing protein [Ignavibacteriaceae bacterium]
MVGGDGMVFTTDGGSNWKLISVPGTGDILGITSVLNNWWFVRGSSIYQSTDDGSSWSMVHTAPSGTYNHLVSGNTNLWAVRSDGGISFYDYTAGIEDETRNTIPESFSISQNYPNPFNPTSKIKYQIPELSFVTLKVYDVLGNEVATLVNEEKPTGTNEVEFNAEGLPSGIYFYQLKAGSFSETKKMILLK